MMRKRHRGPPAEPVIKFIGRAAVFNKKDAEISIVSRLRLALNLTLMRHNANILVKHRSRFAAQLQGNT